MSSASLSATDVPEISRRELVKGLRDRTMTVVDVLSPESFAALHIPGAINVPVAEMARVAPAMLPDRDARLVTYCGGPT